MEKFDFDRLTERRDTACMKWDSISSDPDLLPMWVADMDFETAPVVKQAVMNRAATGIYGYAIVPEHGYHSAIAGWESRRHGYTPDPALTIPTTSVVPAVSALLHALTHPGDGVIIQSPVYNCFYRCIRNQGCREADAPLRRVDCQYPSRFTYEMDFDALEAQAADPRNRVMLLCNPHNPAGRNWTREDLTRVAEICARHNVTVISDEIHCDLTMPGHEFVSYATMPPEYRDRAYVITSPSKAFNTAALHVANIFAGNNELYQLALQAVDDLCIGAIDPFGVDALIAAYDHGEPWLQSLTEYLKGNYEALLEFFNENLPQLPVAILETTYLVWVDIRALGISSDRLEKLLIGRGHVWMNSGSMYGGDGYLRINIATQRSRLLEGLRRMADVIADLPALKDE